MDDGSGVALIGLIFSLFLLWFVLWVVILLPARMARKRGRSAVGWVLVSLILSPLVAIVLLVLLGRSWTAR
ncbi:hypothetical protein [Rhodobacter capsulatus]|jgi:hypothetical protein|uniref:Membrane protein, putative n=1 Tax=Rhodobacter capsulatus (strain ATCC BAA-309 / NBRC 16581 / SB1003) TaxID=272942 RepID=D5ASE5_RHOCB|nr:hypothetical protein [Rhodobacter capsulatus]ADE85036.1 membrane protein, putative [Rhodobacter capsulatus SB 1003]ETD02166.1 hypothetical protein U714_07630 [Rhodobacter capsulatus DE442]ETD77856.1 hypothetical protein U717_07805 [Rhodobacter capsulatus R121]ETE54198.1 hypothetical protein U715_07800 [Rhodobacter capsulatus Y262]MDS0926690.1 hypothetical protein [Rhodobacter capsulatus]